MIYFDNSATTKPYNEVLESFLTVSNRYFGNPSSLHKLGVQSEKLLQQARIQMADLLSVKPSEVFFTSGGTESNNIAIKGAALLHKKKGRHIITSSVEHASVKATMEQLEQNGFEISILPVGEDGRVMAEQIEKEIRKDTILISVMHVNNEVGSVQPIKEIGEVLRKYPDILFHVDAVQSIGKIPFNFKKERVDLVSISAHKFHGLKGTGALIVREGTRIAPILTGGKQECNLRSGTENVAGAVAMAKALRMTVEKSKNGVERMLEIQRMLRTSLSQIEGLSIHTPVENFAPHIVNFSIEGIKSEVLVHALEEKDIYVSTTSACSSKIKSPSHTLVAMGVPSSSAESAIRISLSYDNTEKEATMVINAINEAAKQLRRVRS